MQTLGIGKAHTTARGSIKGSTASRRRLGSDNACGVSSNHAFAKAIRIVHRSFLLQSAGQGKVATMAAAEPQTLQVQSPQKCKVHPRSVDRLARPLQTKLPRSQVALPGPGFQKEGPLPVPTRPSLRWPSTTRPTSAAGPQTKNCRQPKWRAGAVMQHKLCAPGSKRVDLQLTGEPEHGWMHL